MHPRMNSLDWNLARAFHATAVAGSLSAAARRLDLTQPTLSRQVAALERQLGVILFERAGKRLILTPSGTELLEHVRAMEEAGQALMLAATGRSDAIGGRVTLSASDGYAAYVLPSIVQRIRREAPQITLVVVASNSFSDLRRREADIAIRHARPQEPELIGRSLGDSRVDFYASAAWVARNGRPDAPGMLAPTEIIGFDPPEQFAAHLAGQDVPATADQFRLLTGSGVVLWEMVRQGLGVGLMLREIAERTPGMVRLFPHLPGQPVPLWLVTHRELRTSCRIRLVFDLLVDELAGAKPTDAIAASEAV